METEDRIIKKLNEHDENFARLFETQDKLIQKVMTIDEKIDTLATKDEVRLLEDRMMTSFDHQTKMLEKLDHERLATMVRIERVESDVSDLKTR